MDTTHSQRLSRISTLLLAAVGVAFAWVVLTLLLGWSSTTAHADDDSSLLGAVGSTLESSTTAVTDTAGDLLGGVADTATEVVAPIAAPVAAVVEPVAPVVEVVQEVAAPVVTAVADTAGSGIVSAVTDTAVDLVAAVPVVGDVATSLGADDALTSVGTAADGVLQATTGAVATTVASPPSLIPSSPTPVVPIVDDVEGAVSGILPTTPTDAAPGAASMLSLAAALAGTTTGMSSVVFAPVPAATATSAVNGVSLLGAVTGGLLSLLGAVLQADSVLSGPGGAGPGAWVLVALGFVVAYRAWVRRTGIENDTAPLAPAFATDVSPD